MHKTHVAFIAVIGTLMLTACGSKTDPSEKNFGTAIAQHFEKNGELCLGPVGWPVDMEANQLENERPGSDASKLHALEAAGLVKSEDVVVTRKRIINSDTYKVTVKRFTLTDAAKPFSKEKEVRVFRFDGKDKEIQTDLCWGHMALDKVVKWEGPIKLGDYQEALVVYTYKIEGLASWASRPDIQAAYPSVKRYLDGVGKEEKRIKVKLTSEGWEVD